LILRILKDQKQLFPRFVERINLQF